MGLIKTVISGSFRKHYHEIKEMIDQFGRLGIEVLSPKKSNIVNPDDDFVILESDESDNIFFIENEHLSAIKKSDFLYVVNPGGYIGLTVALEMGYACANNKKIYCLCEPNDILLKEFCFKSNLKPELMMNEGIAQHLEGPRLSRQKRTRE